MRIAWIGPTPAEHGTVTHISLQLIEGLADLGFEVDVYCDSPIEGVSERLRERRGVRLVCERNGWEWDRWYSRNQLSQVATGAASRVLVQSRLAHRLVGEHARRSYDLVYQASHLELLGLRPYVRRLPPIVAHPHTHAAGELRWLRRELPLADRCTPAARNRAVIAMMAGRAAIQRRDIHRAELVIALSESFGEQLSRDYGYPADRIAVVPNPIDLGRLAPPERRPARGERPLILFVSRIAVRKGVESVVRLSHRLGDTGAARLAVVGGLTKWSDYRVLLGDLDPRSAEYRRRLSEEELATLYREADVLIQPSRFEPFGLTVAEALASGVPVVASDQVGAAKHVDRAVCRVVPAGDDDALERGVDGLLADLASRRGSALRRQARLEAERLFAPAVASDRLAAALERFRKPARRSPAPAPSGNGRPRTRSLARARR